VEKDENIKKLIKEKEKWENKVLLTRQFNRQTMLHKQFGGV